jgi:two-component system sensor histidine kinase ComP
MSRSLQTRWPASTWQCLIEIAGSTLAMVLIVYAALVAILKVEDGMSWNAHFRVVTLLPEGPAERAGVQLGDRILAIDAHPVDGWHLPVTHWHPGDVLQIAVERSSQRLVLPVKLAPLSPLERWAAIVPLIIAFSFWATSSLMPGLARQSVEVRLFRAFSQVGAVVLATGNLSGVGLVWAGHLFGVSASVLAPLILHFHLALPGARLKRWRRPILFTAYAIGVAVAFPYLLLGRISYGWRAGWGSLAMRIALGSALLGASIWVIYSYITARSIDVRRRLRLVALGTAWGFMPILLLSLLLDVLGFDFVPYQFTMAFLVLIPLTYWYTAVRFDLLRVDLVLNRSLVHLSIALVLGSIYILTLHLVDRFLPDVASHRKLFGVLLLTVASVAAVPLRDRIQRVINRAFYGGCYDYRTVVSDVSRSLTGALGRQVLEELLLDHAASTLWVRGAALLLPEPNSTGRLVGRQHNTLAIEPALLSLKMNGPLARCLCTVHRPIETSWLQQEMAPRNLEPAEARLVHSTAIRWWVPMVNEDRLIGLLLLGARLGDERFDESDLQILNTLSDQATLAIKNILLVEELRLQLKETENGHRVLEQMHRQLWIGREEERKRLARDLHDGPVQQLIAFRYQLGEGLAQLDNPNLRRTLGELRNEASVLLDELRGLCTKLRPPLLDAFGLASAIQAHSEEVEQRHSLKIQLTLDDDKVWQLSEEVAVSLFRIYQEALSNVIRHADASHIVIRLYRVEPKVALDIQDDGTGFVVPDSINLFAAEGHFGLLGIRERIDLLGGEFELTSRPGEGTMLHVRVPIHSCKKDVPTITES